MFGLFIPYYIDQFYPQAGIATLQLLEETGRVKSITASFPYKVGLHTVATDRGAALIGAG